MDKSGWEWVGADESGWEHGLVQSISQTNITSLGFHQVSAFGFLFYK